MTKRDDVDCLDVKRRAQRAPSKKLSRKSPAEQSRILNHLAARSPLWKRLAEAKPARSLEPVRARKKRSAS